MTNTTEREQIVRESPFAPVLEALGLAEIYQRTRFEPGDHLKESPHG